MRASFCSCIVQYVRETRTPGTPLDDGPRAHGRAKRPSRAGTPHRRGGAVRTCSGPRPLRSNPAQAIEHVDRRVERRNRTDPFRSCSSSRVSDAATGSDSARRPPRSPHPEVRPGLDRLRGRKALHLPSRNRLPGRGLPAQVSHATADSTGAEADDGRSPPRIAESAALWHRGRPRMPRSQPAQASGKHAPPSHSTVGILDPSRRAKTQTS